MGLWTWSGRVPEEPSIGFFDRDVVDAGMAYSHQALVIEFPVLVAVRSKPLLVVVSPFVCKPNGYPELGERPEFFDQTVLVFLFPFARQKLAYSIATGKDLTPVSPARIDGVRKGHLLGITSVPSILRHADFLNGRLVRERWKRRLGHGGHSDGGV